MLLLCYQDWKERETRCYKFKLTSTSHHQTARARLYAFRQFGKCSFRYRKDHIIFDFSHASKRIWLAGQSLCCVALSMQYKRTTRNAHHDCHEDHSHMFMPAYSLITKDYNCLLEVARTPTMALRAWATHVLALGQEAKLAAPGIVGQESLHVTRYQ